MSDFDYSIYLKDPDRANGIKKSGSALRTPMSREQRAKQFAPFDALTGLHARLAKAIEEHSREADSAGFVYAGDEETESTNL